MAVTKITNLEFGKMVQAAADKLGKNAEFINSLNVFPVPDGDTGTNMTSSMASGAKYEIPPQCSLNLLVSAHLGHIH